MITMWENLTVAQAIALIGAAWVLVWLIDNTVSVVRKLLGKPVYADHCEHCELVESLTERVDKLEAQPGDAVEDGAR